MKQNIFFLTLVFLVTSCLPAIATPTDAPINTPNESPENIKWINDWLNSPSCNPPCWEGIVPGETTFEGAHQILISNSRVINVVKQTNDKSWDYIVWDFLPVNINEKINEGGIIEASKDGTIGIISLRIGKGGILLGDIIKKFGEPDQVLFPAEDEIAGEGMGNTEKQYHNVYLQYSVQNMILALGIMRQGNETEITPNAEVWVVDFVASGYDFSAFELVMILHQTQWIGYSVYK